MDSSKSNEALHVKLDAILRNQASVMATLKALEVKVAGNQEVFPCLLRTKENAMVSAGQGRAKQRTVDLVKTQGSKLSPTPPKTN